MYMYICVCGCVYMNKDIYILRYMSLSIYIYEDH